MDPAGAEAARRALALGLIVGGALGNAIDRVAYGAVFDFIHFHVGNILLVRLQRRRRGNRCGVVGLLYDALVLERRRHGPAAPEQSP